MPAYEQPQSICQVCKGRIHDAGLFGYQNRWLHWDDVDWVGDPHDAVPAPSDLPKIRIVRDENCPTCEHPETYAEGTTFENGPDLIGCSNCGWVRKVAV